MSATQSSPSCGSPLRGQGTPVNCFSVRASLRFTPARAGNTMYRRLTGWSATVHPCAGREHALLGPWLACYDGSPLRGQGTLGRLPVLALIRRFTPARAGNTTYIFLNLGCASVHPCAGREHLAARDSRLLASGSPLRGQGTQSRFALSVFLFRFTPARAGNTSLFVRPPPSPPVHPCAGREHHRTTPMITTPHGSPLRGQGTRVAGVRVRVPMRFTPARAGNTHRR